MALARLGKGISQDEVFALTGLDPGLGRGANTAELKVALERLGFDVGPVWTLVPADVALQRLDDDLARIVDDLARGVPSIVCMHYDESPATTEHFRLIVGFDPATDEVVYHEPAEDEGAYRRMSRARFLRLWPLRYEPSRWTEIRFRLAPAREPERAPIAKPSLADLAEHVLELKKSLPPRFTITVRSPFVVIGDEAPDTVRSRADGTVAWAKDRLQKDFFARAPEKPLDVWLFRNKPSYEGGVRALFHEEPITPFGYYAPEHGALVMNIATGGGTLVHELVHPFVEADFPDAPAWINEGLGSLFEQSTDRGGHIAGLTNWRLAGLQRAIRDRHLPPLRELVATTSRAFYDEDRGTNYAAARYVFYWLQEHGELAAFYRAARDGHAHDPSGRAALEKSVGELDAFQPRWERWVLTLTFP